jgi:hypothetical protein
MDNHGILSGRVRTAPILWIRGDLIQYRLVDRLMLFRDAMTNELLTGGHRDGVFPRRLVPLRRGSGSEFRRKLSLAVGPPDVADGLGHDNRLPRSSPKTGRGRWAPWNWPVANWCCRPISELRPAVFSARKPPFEARSVPYSSFGQIVRNGT